MAGQMLNSGSGASVMNHDNLNRLTRGQSFGSSTERFDQNGDKKTAKMPGPGKYYMFGAGNGNQTSRNSSIDGRSLDH